MRAAGVVAAFTLLVLPTAARAGDGFGVPPAKVDFGYLTFATDDGVYAGGQWMVGLNWATIYPKRTRFDVGLGYVGAVFDNPFPQPVVIPPKGKGVTIVPERPETIQLHGGYLELSARIASGAHWRTWLSGRGELSSVDGESSLGTAARISTEIWGGVMSGGNKGVAVGVFSLGVWVEASARELGDRAMVTSAAAGMSVRIPLIAVGG